MIGVISDKKMVRKNCIVCGTEIIRKGKPGINGAKTFRSGRSITCKKDCSKIFRAISHYKSSYYVNKIRRLEKKRKMLEEKINGYISQKKDREK